MNKYTVVIEEMITEEFSVLANDAEEAMNTAISKYNEGEFVLEPGNLVCKQIAITEPEIEASEWMEF